METEAPFPVLVEDQEVRGALIPRDDLIPPEQGFEVICLGSAQAPGGHAVPQMDVSLAVGQVRRRLRVFGDRSWLTGGKRASDPVPFMRMPMTWARAFGGTCEVEVDRGSVVEISHAVNPTGRGFDAARQGQLLGEELRSPAGYPRIPEDSRLPNIEDPERPIKDRREEPAPLCWATLPQLMSPLHLDIDLNRPLKSTDPVEMYRELQQIQVPSGCYRAHPDWIIPPPPEAAVVEMNGMNPVGKVRFTLPRTQVLADLVVEQRVQTWTLTPRMLLLFPDQWKFCLVFRNSITVEHHPGDERCVRLRTVDEPSPQGPGEVPS